MSEHSDSKFKCQKSPTIDLIAHGKQDFVKGSLFKDLKKAHMVKYSGKFLQSME